MFQNRFQPVLYFAILTLFFFLIGVLGSNAQEGQPDPTYSSNWSGTDLYARAYCTHDDNLWIYVFSYNEVSEISAQMYSNSLLDPPELRGWNWTDHPNSWSQVYPNAGWISVPINQYQSHTQWRVTRVASNTYTHEMHAYTYIPGLPSCSPSARVQDITEYFSQVEEENELVDCFDETYLPTFGYDVFWVNEAGDRELVTRESTSEYGDISFVVTQKDVGEGYFLAVFDDGHEVKSTC